MILPDNLKLELAINLTNNPEKTSDFVQKLPKLDYNANDSSPTKVELISLETEIDLPPFSSPIGEPVGPGNGTQIQSIMDSYRSTTNVTTNNTDALIFGSGNIVTDGVRGIVVGDYQALTSDGIATTNPSIIDSNGNLLYTSLVNNPQTYVTTVGLYNDNNELLAIAKLSKPLVKDFTKEALVRIKLDY